ncbi:hypothetical protein [Methylohalobius crimeensis]|uniref:hypothetical protein n=1 Tax=Methylohalobius crimeensis TaxID=244365 RepID=UPI0003F64CB8|nr:hypothetical protein [Methylohalobius crimeensis]
MKAFKLFIASGLAFAAMTVAHAEPLNYEVKVVYWDDTEFRGSFDYDADTQKVTNLQGLLDDTLMGNIEEIRYQLHTTGDGKGGITAYAFAMNTTEIDTNPPVNNNVAVAINFNAIDPVLGPTDPDQLAYMDCSPGGLMGQTCMYHLSWHDPVYPMEGGHGILSETITAAGGQLSRSDCLLNWAENSYPNMFSPAQAASQSSSPYYYRFYPNTNLYMGISAEDSHVYYLEQGADLRDVGHLADWLALAGC